MRVLIDADGCPVVSQAVKIAARFGLEAIILCDTSHEISREGARTIVVPKGADSVDFRLANLLLPGDLAVTQDYGLVALCLARGGLAIDQDGMRYTGENIDALLLARHTSRKIRMGGGRLRGKPKRTSAQDEAFEKSFIELIEEHRL